MSFNDDPNQTHDVQKSQKNAQRRENERGEKEKKGEKGKKKKLKPKHLLVTSGRSLNSQKSFVNIDIKLHVKRKMRKKWVLVSFFLNKFTFDM